MDYRSEFCGSDGKLQWRIFDANGNAVGYAASPQQADSLITLLSAAAPQVVADVRKIKTWQERTGNHRVRPGSEKHMIAEIAELRAALEGKKNGS